MNILHVITAPAAGGAEVYVKDLAIQLSKQGHLVHIGFLSHAEEIGRSRDFETLFIEELNSAGVCHFFIGNAARRMPWVGAIRVRKYSIEHSLDVYHAHLTYGVIFGTLLRIPRVYTHHNIKMRMNRMAFKLLSFHIDGLIGISRVCAQALVEYSGRDVTTIYNGVDIRRFSRSTLTAREIEGRVNCIAVGQICAQKNYSMLVMAIAALPADIKSRIRVKIVGDGLRDDVAVVQELISKFNLDDIVELAGHQNNVSTLMEESQLFFMSSDYEGLPIALIEAAISGLPSVVTDAGGCGEVIDICQNGIVVEPDNCREFAEAIEEIIGNPKRFSEYSANALTRSSVFDIGTALEGHLDLYAELRSIRKMV